MTAKNILLVEDEYGTAEVLQLMLEIEGWRVVLASNGRDALARIATHGVPDCVLSDYMMPIMNGAQLGLALRAQAASANVPIVMTSAAEEAEVRREFSDYDAFIHKPYRIDELMPLMRRLLASGRTSLGSDAAATREESRATPFIAQRVQAATGANGLRLLPAFKGLTMHWPWLPASRLAEPR